MQRQAVQQQEDSFFLDCDGMQVWEVCSHVQEYFNVNILVFDDIKSKEIHGRITGVDLKQTLDSIAWLLGVEYVFKDGIYFFGSNTKTIVVLPSSGLDTSIEGLFKDVQLKKINDKLVICGSERDVAKIKSIYDQLLERQFGVFRLYAIEISHESDIELGMDIDKSVSYAFSWESLSAASYNPIQSLAMSLKASLVAKDSLLRVSSLIDTDVGLLSGNPVNFQVGQDTDRPLYSQSNYSDTNVVQSYNTQHTGLIINLTGSYDPKAKNWYITFSVENSEAKSDLVKTLTSLVTFTRVGDSSPVQILAKLNSGKFSEEHTKGIPFLCDIPYAGRLFRISHEYNLKREIIFVLQLKTLLSPNIPQPLNQSGTMHEIKNLLTK